MKKIGIVTVTYVNNFGSHLQSFALQEVIRKLGYGTEIINPKGLNKDIGKRRFIYLLSRWHDIAELKSYFGLIKTKVASKFIKRFRKLLQERSNTINLFASKEYTFSPIVNTWEDMTKMCAERYSTVIIGSDQNWRPANIAGGYYTIEYVPDEINKVAYSTSFGIARVIPSQYEKAKFFLGRINHISVRENTGQKIIKEILNRDVPVVCDPTILLKKEEWRKFIALKKQTNLIDITNIPYILCYFLGENKEHREFAKRLRNITGYKIVSILMGEQRYFIEKKDSYDIDIINIGPLDFVNLIDKAQYVCTDSFHGCAFSLIFQKQFYAFYKTEQGSKMSVNSRLDSMLGWAGVANRIIKGRVEISDKLLQPIQYKEVTKRLEEKREMSMSFLEKSLL